MASFGKAQDGRGWLTNLEILDLGVVKANVGTAGVP